MGLELSHGNTTVKSRLVGGAAQSLHRAIELPLWCDLPFSDMMAGGEPTGTGPDGGSSGSRPTGSSVGFPQGQLTPFDSMDGMGRPPTGTQDDTGAGGLGPAGTILNDPVVNSPVLIGFDRARAMIDHGEVAEGLSGSPAGTLAVPGAGRTSVNPADVITRMPLLFYGTPHGMSSLISIDADSMARLGTHIYGEAQSEHDRGTATRARPVHDMCFSHWDLDYPDVLYLRDLRSVGKTIRVQLHTNRAQYSLRNIHTREIFNWVEHYPYLRRLYGQSDSGERFQQGTFHGATVSSIPRNISDAFDEYNLGGLTSVMDLPRWNIPEAFVEYNLKY